ncbi:hypothetical protein B0H19DRAFT_1066557 [Mycena capillaripes]|nr:hypothetical protein B0H19DRAFT_1066557 [Mycena capillaripes]
MSNSRTLVFQYNPRQMSTARWDKTKHGNTVVNDPWVPLMARALTKREAGEKWEAEEHCRNFISLDPNLINIVLMVVWVPSAPGKLSNSLTLTVFGDPRVTRTGFIPDPYTGTVFAGPGTGRPEGIPVSILNCWREESQKKSSPVGASTLLP